MIRLAVLLSIIISTACGSYALVLLSRLRKIYRADFVSSFFYYEFLRMGFGLYGILGSLAIKEILLRYDLLSDQVESIVIAIPFFGVPFLIASWYLLLKMVSELLGKKIPPFVSLIYFGITTLFFMGYGIILKNSANPDYIIPGNISQGVRVAFYSFDMAIKLYISITLLVSSVKERQPETKNYLKRFALLLLLPGIMSSLALHFAYLHTIIGIYFLLLFFGSDIAIIILSKSYLRHNSSIFTEVTDRLEELYQLYGISKREREVITEICNGLTNQQIADRLFISLQTVKDHIHNIFRKVKVTNRVQLTQLFTVQHG